MLLIQREPAVNANAENMPTQWGVPFTGDGRAVRDLAQMTSALGRGYPKYEQRKDSCGDLTLYTRETGRGSKTICARPLMLNSSDFRICCQSLKWHLHFGVKLSVVVVIAVGVEKDEAPLHVRQVIAHDLNVLDGGDGHVHYVAAVDVLQVGQLDDWLVEGEADHVALEGEVLDVFEDERPLCGVVNAVVEKLDLRSASLLGSVEINRGQNLSPLVPFGIP